MRTITHHLHHVLLAVAAAVHACAGVLSAAVPAPPASDQGQLLVLVGAPGEEDYAATFERTAATWTDAGTAAGFGTHVIGVATDETIELPPIREQLAAWIAQQKPDDTLPLWFVFVGHGTFDGRVAKMNLLGADVSAPELRDWFKPFTRPLVLIHGGSASAPFLNALSGPRRIVITATENANEINYARFGERFANAISDDDADIDRDGQTSVLEAFVSAANQTELFYDENGRLSTEHALIDDNGDGRGTPYDWFNGTRIAKKSQTPNAKPDGDRARLLSLRPSLAEQNLTEAQRQSRDELEAQVEKLRLRKPDLPVDEYYAQLEPLFRQLAQIYATAASQ
jgi:hypothetical protein